MAIKSIMLRFDKFLHETPKAYLIRVGQQEHWMPKKLCRDFITNKKLGGNVSIPAFLYERITGESIENAPICNATFIVEKHKPSRLEPVTPTPDASLIKKSAI
jgi:hypothetical protein